MSEISGNGTVDCACHHLTKSEKKLKILKEVKSSKQI